MKRYMAWLGLFLGLPLTMGAKGSCGAINSTDPAPDVEGQWTVAYESKMDIVVKVGGAVYKQTLPGTGGAFVIDHAGTQLMFDIDCSRPEVICPYEVWPTQVSIDQRDEMFQHRMWVKIPTQTCSGATAAPKSTECGAGTNNPDCKPVCMGSVTTSSADAFGLINEPGTNFSLLLGGGVVTNGINCALLGVSWAKADLVNVGTSTSPDWHSTDMKNGEVKTAFAGGCLWAGDPQMTGTLHALVIGASVEITTPFTAKHQ